MAYERARTVNRTRRTSPAIWRRTLGNIDRGDIVLSGAAGTSDEAGLRLSVWPKL